MNGPIPRPVEFSWPWGDAVPSLDELAPQFRLIDLGSSITRSDAFGPGKAVHYRMSPDNVPVLAVARPDACALANNHVVDFGYPGFEDTLDALSGAGLRPIGAGLDAAQARRPAVVTLPGAGRVVIFSSGTTCSRIRSNWAATPDRPGVDLIPDLSERTAAELADRTCVVQPLELEGRVERLREHP